MTPVTLADFSAMLPELFLLAAACLVLGIDLIWPRLRQQVLAYVSLAGLAGTALLLARAAQAGAYGVTLKGMFILDPLAVVFKVAILVATALVVLASMDFVERIPAFRGEYYFLVLLTTVGMLFMASANDFLSLYITVELATFHLYILVAYLKDDAKSSEAGLKLFILGVFTAAILVYGISLIYGQTGQILFDGIARGHPQAQASGALLVGIILVVAGLGFKIGAVPFHVWIPDVYQGAPTPVTAFISVAPKIAAFALILRVLFSAFPDLGGTWLWAVQIAAAASMTFGNIVAIAQRSMKRLLAYSGIAQIGNLLIGIAAGNKMGVDSLIFYLVAYLFANIGAFAVVIIYENLTGREGVEDLKGLSRRSPLMAAAMLIFLLSLAGVPPLAGFLAKVYIFTAAVQAHLIVLVSIGLANFIISLYYYLVVVKHLYISAPTDQAPIRLTGPLKAVLYVTMAGVVALGIYPAPVVDLIVASTTVFARFR